jgi:hypothetical protein
MPTPQMIEQAFNRIYIHAHGPKEGDGSLHRLVGVGGAGVVGLGACW